MAADKESRIGIESILDLRGTNREARAYAFLYAAFKRTEISSNPVRDALDCLIPFVAAHLDTIVGKQVRVEGIKDYLKTTFGFDFPIYAVEQLLPALQKAGYVEYNRSFGIYIATEQETQFDFIKSEIEIEFDEVEKELRKHAAERGFEIDPPSGSWGNALITFLRSRTDRVNVKFAKVKGALIEPGKAETALVGGFIKSTHERNPELFSKILNVFMGVLVEEFISSVSEIGAVDLQRPVQVLYDTAVILRLLGCSGKLLKLATDELTRYLQDLGFYILYFSGNEAEVSNILNTLIYVKDSGREIEGETAEAIANGEVTITEIRALQNTFPERLAAMGVFSAEKLEKSAFENAKYQIDEREFSEYLKRRAIEGGRIYGQQNRENDAGYLGAIMRLRRRNNTRDLAGCGFVFVTPNKFLAQMSRRYLVEQRFIQPQHCPPILSVGQMATIAWLMKDQALEPEKVGRELLANCFAAVRPDQEWFRYFREGVEKVAGSVDEYFKDSNQAMMLQAARRIAQEESFGETAIVRELNMAEILERAKQESLRVLAQKEEQWKAERTAAEEKLARLARKAEERRALEAERAARERDEAVRKAAAETTRAVQEQLQESMRASAYRKADTILRCGKWGAILFFIIALIASFHLERSGSWSLVAYLGTGSLGVVNVLSFMDLIGIKLVTQLLSKLRDKIARILMS